MVIENEKIYKKALMLKGEISQLDICIEENSELIQSIIKYKRNEGLYEREILKEKIIEELADVHIMTEQLIINFGPEGLKMFEIFKQKKLDRLKKRLEMMEKGKKIEE